MTFTDGLMFRSAELAGVSFPERIIELVVMPYETETRIVERDRAFTEIVSRGAFDGIEARNGGRVRVNRDHDLKRTVGRVVSFHTGKPDGLYAEIKISRTELGEETLALAEDGCLDASAGFGLMRDKDGRVVPGAEVWETRSRVRLNRLYLGHVALTPDPAYESARVLAVRQNSDGAVEAAQDVRPNRDRIELESWQERYAVLDDRYSPS